MDNGAMADEMPPTLKRHWHVLGTGAMGCLWAANLAAAGRHVTLIGRDRPRPAAYHGVTLETAAGGELFEVALENAGSPGNIERLLVCTKACDVLAALDGIAHRLTRDAAIVLLQNGMGFHDAAATLLPGARLYCALTTEGAWCPAPFHVRHAGRGTTLLGRYPRGLLADAQALAGELPETRFEIRAVADTEQELWRKLAVNCAINALTAVHGCPNGALLQPGPAHEEFMALCVEIAAILEALGHAELAGELPALAGEVARRTATNRSSMLQDVLAGRPTEIDYINGFLRDRARAAGVPCPLNEALCRRVREIEHGLVARPDSSNR